MTLQSLSKLIFDFVKAFNIPVTETSIYLELQKHPEQFSMLAIADVLNTFQVNNGAYQLDKTELSDDICPFISHISRNEGEFVVIRKVDTEKVIFSNGELKTEMITRSEFERYFTGNILIADDEVIVSEQNYRAKRRKEIVESMKLPFLISSTLLLLILYCILRYDYLINYSISLVIWEVTKLSGLILGVLLILQNLDANNSFIKRLCTKGKKMDCNSILSSKAAKITDEISWSEVGFFYFVSSSLAILIYGGSLAVIQGLAFLSVLCLPYTFYSVYYQAFIAKKWCVLCTITQGILWIEFFISVQFLFIPLLKPSFNEVTGLLIIFLLPVTVWVFLKPYFKSRREVDTLKQQLWGFKSNAELFNALLVTQPYMEMPDDSYSLVLGSRNPSNIITLAAHPTCTPCRKAHNTLHTWLQSDESLQVRIIYALDGESNQGINYKAVRHMMNVSLSGSDIIEESVHGWYNQEIKDFESWSIRYPVPFDSRAEELVAQQIKWSVDAGIVQTPTIFINGYRLPDLYRLEDIRYLI